MKIVRFPQPPTITIEEFADQHGLVMEVYERPKSYGLPRYYARFDRCELKDDCLLKTEHGNGESEFDAIEDYARHINGKTLVFDAGGDARREIQVPELKVTQ